MRRALALTALLLAGCAGKPHAPSMDPTARVPPFARLPYEPLSRAAVVAIALREWRLFGAPVDDDPPHTRPPAAMKPEREEGLWQRVGEYWWLGLNAGDPDSGYTGKHDAQGRVFAPDDDDLYAWSAAFVSYVMRIAGAGLRFPYAAAHHDYIDAAYDVSVGRAGWVVSAQAPERYAPQPGDLICLSRAQRQIRFEDLPVGQIPGHCDIVVAAGAGVLDVIGGNVDDAVTLKHVPVTDAGLLAEADGTIVDRRYPWFVVLRVLFDR